MKPILLFFMLCLLGSTASNAQNIGFSLRDSIAASLSFSHFVNDPEPSSRVFIQDYGNGNEKSNGDVLEMNKPGSSPKKALILSAVLPGAGQIYNRKYWKLPIIYGSLGGMAYLISKSGQQYKKYQQEHIASGGENRAIKAQRDLYHKRQVLSYVGFSLAYLLTAADAYVDAHLMSFNVNEDLSFRALPEVQYIPGIQNSSTLGLQLSFHW